VVLNVADLEKHVYEAGKLVVEKLAAEARSAGVQVRRSSSPAPPPK